MNRVQQYILIILIITLIIFLSNWIFQNEKFIRPDILNTAFYINKSNMEKINISKDNSTNKEGNK